MRRDDAGALAVVFWMYGCGVFDGVDGALSQHGSFYALIIFHRHSFDPRHDSAPLGLSVVFGSMRTARLALRVDRRYSGSTLTTLDGLIQRNRNVLVNGLPLIVVFRMRLPVWSGDGLRGLVGLEAQVALFVHVGESFVAQPAIAKHQIVMSLQILRVNRQSLIELGDGRCIF